MDKVTSIQRRGDSRVFEAILINDLVNQSTDFESKEVLESIADGIKAYLDRAYPDEIPVRYTVEKQPPRYVPVPEVLNEDGEPVAAEPRGRGIAVLSNSYENANGWRRARDIYRGVNAS